MTPSQGKTLNPTPHTGQRQWLFFSSTPCSDNVLFFDSRMLFSYFWSTLAFLVSFCLFHCLLGWLLSPGLWVFTARGDFHSTITIIVITITIMTRDANSVVLCKGRSQKNWFFWDFVPNYGLVGVQSPKLLSKNNRSVKTRFFRTPSQNRGGGGWVGVQSLVVSDTLVF